MSNSVLPQLRRIMAGGRGKLSAADAGRAAMALAVLTGVAIVAEPAPAMAEYASAPNGQVRVAQAIRPVRLDEATAKAFEGAIAKGAPDAALMRAAVAERVAAKRVVAEAMRAGLSTDEPDATLPVSPKGLGVPLRDVRPFEDAVDRSYEAALAADPAHADLINAVKGQRDAEAEVGHQADLISGMGRDDDEPEASAPAFR